MAPNISANKRQRVFLRDGKMCFYCGRTLHTDYPFNHNNFNDPRLDDYLAINHLDLQRDGDTHHDDNLVACCRSCNSSKGGRTLEAYRFSLELKHPFVQAREALKLTRSLVKLPMDDQFLAGIKLLEAQHTAIVFPGEKRQSELKAAQENIA